MCVVPKCVVPKCVVPKCVVPTFLQRLLSVLSEDCMCLDCLGHDT